MGTVQSQDLNNTPVVDLTQSSECLTNKSNTLKTLYFSSKNFNRHISLRKKLVTTSLVNLPVIHKSVIKRRQYSATISSKKIEEKLAILNIPEQFLDPSDFNDNHENILTKTMLTESDQKIINWVIEQEINAEQLCSLPSNDFSLLNTEFESIEELCEAYDVNSNNTFD